MKTHGALLQVFVDVGWVCRSRRVWGHVLRVTNQESAWTSLRVSGIGFIVWGSQWDH